MTKTKLITLSIAFRIPLIVLIGLIIYIVLSVFKLQTSTIIVAIATIALGSFSLVKETCEKLKAKQFAIDYIAILAIVIAVITQEYLVGCVIALMLSTGRTLEEYGANMAKRSLSLLADRIPQHALVEQNKEQIKTPISQVRIGDIILVRKGEVVPLDGNLLSKEAVLDEASLTGEPYPVEKIAGDAVHSGTVNVGDIIRISVIREELNSTYNKIIRMVETAEKEKAPLVRLADKYSVWFTLITFFIAGIAFAVHQSLESVLAVLVVATPCPLILATPIALLGGVNAAAKKRIIIKNLSSIEVLSRVNAIIFDKTGTITLGKPTVIDFVISNEVRNPRTGTKISRFARDDKEIMQLLGIAEAIERNSLHPLAKAVVNYAKEQKAPLLHATNIKELVGKGITGNYNRKVYTLSKLPSQSSDMIIGFYEEKKLLGTFSFVDEVKKESKATIKSLQDQNVTLALLTGDKQSVAQQLVENLGIHMVIRAEAKPEDKADFVKELQKKHKKIVAMVGDGINDAPALAISNVGMVFSNEEQTAASEAADIVFLGGTFSQVIDALQGAKRTLSIALQSILWGIGLSIFFMILAALGFIPPIFGAGLQEAIDIAVILNALRASR